MAARSATKNRAIALMPAHGTRRAGSRPDYIGNYLEMRMQMPRAQWHGTCSQLGC